MDYDVIIVGARIAGATLATLLGQRGYRVLLLDKAHFPSDTLSTHFFRDPALRIFEQLGVLDDVKSTAPALGTVWDYIDGHVLSEPVDTGDEHLNYYMCVRRITLDWILAQRVSRERAVEFRQGALVKDVLWNDQWVTGIRWIENDEAHEAKARVVVGADGFYSSLAKILKPEFETQFPVQRCMYYTYYQGIEPLDQAAYNEHHFLGDSLTYVFPTDGNLFLVAISLPFSEFSSFKKESQARLQAHLDALPLLASRLRRAEIVSEVRGSGNIPCYQRVPYGRGWALVGDAHQVMDPWSGMGIDHATTHASMLADALHRYLSEASPWEISMNDFRALARQWSEKSYRRTVTFAADFRPMTHAALERRGLI